MGGRPKLRALETKIARMGGDEVVFAEVMAGRKMKDIAEGLRVTTGLLYMWIRGGGERRQQAFKEARAASSSALVDQGLDILDGLAEPNEYGIPLNSAEVSAAKHRAEYRKWMAGQVDQENWGKGGEKGVVLQVENLHLEALRAAGSPAGAKAKMIEGEVVDEDAGDEDDGVIEAEWEDVEEDEGDVDELAELL